MAEFIEILKIIASWPIVFLSVVIFLSIKFDSAFKELIPRLSFRANYKDFGLIAESQINEVKREQTKESPTVDQSQPKAVQPATSATTDLQEVANSWRFAAYIWEYRYLNYFLKRNTQRALDILYVSNQKIPFSLAVSVVGQYAPDQNEQKAILDAMTIHHLVEVSAELIGITPKGREYVEFRGVPQAPAPTIA